MRGGFSGGVSRGLVTPSTFCACATAGVSGIMRRSLFHRDLRARREERALSSITIGIGLQLRGILGGGGSMW